ncbi:hypothetical protein KQH52_07425, partial [Mycetohabitans sp. B7]|uniref:hypothetical protein n=1 Tax=Mycetohabitans sp. B7 TaxID=2841844 RepID=UPI001F2B6105
MDREIVARLRWVHLYHEAGNERTMINEQFAALKKAIFERALGAELTHHLGYEKGQAKLEESE